MSLHLTLGLRERLAAVDRPLSGMWLCSGSPLVADICAGAGHDWLLIDMEHTANSLESVLLQLQVVAAYDIAAVVRVPTGDPVLIKQVLDLGATTILVPMVDTADQARELVKAVRYPPAGMRGVGSALSRSSRWSRIPDYLATAEDRVSLFVQIETIAAVDAAAEIVAVDGIDGIFVGPSDLAASLGLLGQQTHPDVVAAVHRAFDAARGAEKPFGVNAFDPAAARTYAHAGARFILVGADVVLLARGSEDLSTILQSL
ncbi:MAG: HpcH/HpaI aldolase/citrate lyase family protein [Lacisediminihabitans sp.]